MNKVLIGDKLKDLRKGIGITQKVISDYLNIKVNSYSQYENNVRQPDFNTLKKIADYYSVTIDYLFDFEVKSKLYDQQLLFTRYRNLCDSIYFDLELYKKNSSNNDLLITISKKMETLGKVMGELQKGISIDDLEKRFELYSKQRKKGD